MHDWLEESALCPYAAQLRVPAHRLLVLAPHPDDEVLGCGGLVAAMLAQGADVHVVIISDGGLGGDAATREQESMAANRVLGGGASGARLGFWRLPDRALAQEPTLVARLQHLIVTCGADCVLLPSPFEIHPDHRALCLAGLHAVRASCRATDVLFYEVGQALMPDVLVDITPFVARKRAALACFRSQLDQQPYDEQVLGLNRFRAYTLGQTVTHAEAFQRVQPEVLQLGMQGVLQSIESRLLSRFGGTPGAR
jgi:LmbE family N-acetylglucosaminyl deacetylase